MRIAIASTGLGHVARGVETWAADTAAWLARRGRDVTLFSAADAPSVPYEQVVRCCRRGDEANARWQRRLPRWAWRWGLTSPYGFEQATFWHRLWPALRRGRYDVLHVQDGWLAWWCRQYRRAGLVRTQELLANGTEEELPFLRRFRYVQQLAPWHLEHARAAYGPAADTVTADWTMMPNFVDVDRFRPDADARAARRRELELPADATVIFCAAALQRHHKRVDYVIEEFARLLAEPPPGSSLYLLLAGAATADTPELEAQATALAPGRVRVLRNVPRERMPGLFAAADLFVLASRFEMLGIVLLEAMACGVPAIAHAHPVLKWVVGPGGLTADLEPPGALAAQLRTAATPEWCRQHAPLARAHVAAQFAPEVVIPRYEAWYEQVVSARRR